MACPEVRKQDCDGPTLSGMAYDLLQGIMPSVGAPAPSALQVIVRVQLRDQHLAGDEFSHAGVDQMRIYLRQSANGAEDLHVLDKKGILSYYYVGHGAPPSGLSGVTRVDYGSCHAPNYPLVRSAGLPLDTMQVSVQWNTSVGDPDYHLDNNRDTDR